MVAPGFLESPDVIRWLNGVKPAWTALASESYNALHAEPSASNRTIRLDPSLTAADLSGSAIVHAAQTLLKHVIDADGLKLTAKGNLSRAVVAEICQIIEWPDFDKERLFHVNKVINESDFLPLHFLRILMQAIKLFRKSKGTLMPTRLGNRILSEGQHGALQAILIHIAFWHMNLRYFDRAPIASWPQKDAGVVLWSLSVSANDWLDRVTLTRLCTVPVIGVLEAAWDLGSFAMQARILGPLTWFGLLEHRREPNARSVERHLYRKTPLFDRFVQFDVQIERPHTNR